MPQRLQRSRAKGWRKPPNSICVTRPGIFGNPFKTAAAFRTWMKWGLVTKEDLRPEWMPMTMERAEKLLARRGEILRRLPELRGFDLLCYCGLDKDCHADLYLEMANQ